MANCIATFQYHPQIAPCKSEYDRALREYCREQGLDAPTVGMTPPAGFQYQTWYSADYLRIFKDVQRKILPEKETFRELIKTDLFFIVYFVANWEDGQSTGNKPFIVERCREIEEGPQNGTVDIWSREHGKAVDLDEPILTTQGWKKHGELVVGDYVYSPSGKPVMVEAVSPVWVDDPCYRVEFETDSVVVNGEHLWEVWRGDEEDWLVLNTEEMWKGNQSFSVQPSVFDRAYPKRRQIIDIIPVETRPTSCIQVEGGLYLVGRSLITTHNSTCITIGLTVKRILNNPECTTAIFSYKKPAAEKFLDSIRKILELPIMQWAFPDICYENPSAPPPTGSYSWSLQGGIRVKRENNTKREHTVEAFGLVEGMPTGGHFDHRIYDDVETDDMASNPEQLRICYEKLMMSRNLGREGGTEQVIGTYYSHCGVLVKLGEKKDYRGELQYRLRIFPGTHDGTITGRPVFFSQEYLDSKKTDPGFNTQILCNPTPGHSMRLRYAHFKEIPRSELPTDRVKFVIIDPAGDKEVMRGSDGDPWAMITVSIQPDKDELGLSNVYIEDGIADTFTLDTAVSAGCTLYRRAGKVSLLGIEQVGQSTHYKHFKDALQQDHGVYLELKQKGRHGGNLLLLTPNSRNKNHKIESALSWPLTNGKLHIVDDLAIKPTLREECDKFPFFHVNVLDALSYLYDILADPTTPMVRSKSKGSKPDMSKVFRR